MTQQINLATRDGIRPAQLFALFDSCIAGEPFTFAVHRHLSCSTHIKVSEFKTGMGVAEIPLDSLAPHEPLSTDDAAFASQGQMAVAGLINARGEDAVVQVLLSNRLSAQVLNERGLIN